MDTAQILLIVVVVVLAFLLLLLGLQVFFILKEFKQTVVKLNKVLDDTGLITESVARPISNMSTLLAGLKTGVSIMSMFTKKKKSPKQEEDEQDTTNE